MTGRAVIDGAAENALAVGTAAGAAAAASRLAIMLAKGLVVVVVVVVGAGLPLLDAAGANLSAADQAAWPVPVVGFFTSASALFGSTGSSERIISRGSRRKRMMDAYRVRSAVARLAVQGRAVVALVVLAYRLRSKGSLCLRRGT